MGEVREIEVNIRGTVVNFDPPVQFSPLHLLFY